MEAKPEVWVRVTSVPSGPGCHLLTPQTLRDLLLDRLWTGRSWTDTTWRGLENAAETREQ